MAFGFWSTAFIPYSKTEFNNNQLITNKGTTVAVYESEQEQLEEIKKWWKENGYSVLTGVALGLAILFGWRRWEAYTNSQAENASAFYEQVLMNLEQNQGDQARQVANGLLSEQSNSPYASLAQLNLAAQDLKEGNLDSSHARLQWVMERNALPQMTHLARLRRVKLFLSQGKIDEAKKLMDSVADKGRFKASYTVLQGDIAMAQGQLEVARTAYTEALQSDTLAGGEGLFSKDEKNLVQMKLDNLGATKETRIETRLPVSLPPDALGTPSTAKQNVLTVPAVPSSSAATVTPGTTPKDNKPVSEEVSKSVSPKATPAQESAKTGAGDSTAVPPVPTTTQSAPMPSIPEPGSPGPVPNPPAGPPLPTPPPPTNP